MDSETIELPDIRHVLERFKLEKSVERSVEWDLYFLEKLYLEELEKRILEKECPPPLPPSQESGKKGLFWLLGEGRAWLAKQETESFLNGFITGIIFVTFVLI